MPVFKGNTSGSIMSTGYNIPSTIVSWHLTDKTGSGVTVSLIVATGDGPPVYVWTGAIGANETEKSDVPIRLLSGYQIIILTSGSVDYYLSIE